MGGFLLLRRLLLSGRGPVPLPPPPLFGLWGWGAVAAACDDEELFVVVGVDADCELFCVTGVVVLLSAGVGFSFDLLGAATCCELFCWPRLSSRL